MKPKINQNINTYTIPYTPHTSQIKVHNSNKRFKVVVAGRSWGKTISAVGEAVKQALMETCPVLYVCPMRKQAKAIAWLILKTMVKNICIAKSEQDLTVTLLNGSLISLDGADNPDGLRGQRPKFIVLEEYADMPEITWTEVLRPALTGAYGVRAGALFIGTPKGRNHFYRLVKKIQQDPTTYANYELFIFKTRDNPYVTAEDIEDARLTLPPHVFRQEYEGSFESFDGLAFDVLSETRHQIERFPIPDTYTIYSSIDPHPNVPHHVLYIAVSPPDTNGNTKKYICGELVEKATAEILAKDIFDYEQSMFGRNADIRIIDTSSEVEDMTTRLSFRKELLKYGINTKLAKKRNKMARYMAAYSLFQKEEMVFFSDCRIAWRQFTEIEWAKKKGSDTIQNELDPNAADHQIDNTFYILNYGSDPQSLYSAPVSKISETQIEDELGLSWEEMLEPTIAMAISSVMENFSKGSLTGERRDARIMIESMRNSINSNNGKSKYEQNWRNFVPVKP